MKENNTGNLRIT